MFSKRVIGICFALSIFLKNAEARLTGEEIIGGSEAVEGQFPYQAAIYVMGELSCGGAIISERHILTAAHCAIFEYGFSFMQLTVKAGIIDGGNGTGGITVERIYMPWPYTPKNVPSVTTMNYDIAVLKLSENLVLSPESGLQAVNLPRKIEHIDKVTGKPVLQYLTYQGETATLSGFGVNRIKVYSTSKGTLNEDGSSDHLLRFAESVVISNHNCQKAYNQSSIENNKSILCAKMKKPSVHEKTGVCSGDSGGPLVYDDTIIGVVSRSPKGCSESKRPAKYSRVSSFNKFIDNAMNEIDLAKMRVAQWDDEEEIYVLVDESKNSEMAKKYWNPKPLKFKFTSAELDDYDSED